MTEQRDHTTNMKKHNMLRETLHLYRRLFPFVKPYLKTVFLACLCVIPLGLCSAGIAYLVKPALDDVFLNKDMSMLAVIPLAVIVLYTVRGTLEFSYNFLLGSTGHRIIKDLRETLYRHMQTLSLSFFSKNPTGFLMARVTNDVALIQNAVNTGLINIFKELFTIAGLVGVLITQDARLAGIAFLVLPWAGIPIWRFGKKGRKFSTQGQERVGKIATFVMETIKGYRIVQAFGMEEYEAERFSRENMRLLRIRLKRLKVRAFSGPLMEFIGGIAGAAVVFYGGYNVLNGTSTPGSFFSFMAALLLLYGPTRGVSTAYQDVQEGLAGAKRIFDVLDARPEIREKKNALQLPSVRGHITFSKVSFGYNRDCVLRDVALNIMPGEVIAVVGMTGSGKTTLVNLIPRFYDVTSGSVCIDGHDVRDVTLYSLRSQIALVSQHPYLFNDTVFNNIAYGTPDTSKERVVAAAGAAFIDEFIRELPDGYDTVVGEQGVKLSGGQRQRIAIARAIVKDAPVLILDEATSSLDSKIESDIQHSLERLIHNRTTLIISHRLSTIKNADRTIVLADGTIAEEGTHDELFALGGEYAKLYSIYLQDSLTSHG